MSEIVYTRRISAVDVRNPCLIPKKMEPVIDNTIVVILATLIGEEYDPVRENTADFRMVNPA
jgi:hypothetical protein